MGVLVKRDDVMNAISVLDPEGTADREPKFKRKRAKGIFYSEGPNWAVSLDGHDKLAGFQNWMFPIKIYG